MSGLIKRFVELTRTAAVLLLSSAAMNGALGQSPDVAAAVDQPILMQADEMRYDSEYDIVTASGHVEVSQQQRVLLADSISYNRKQDLLSASGNVSLMEPTGEVLFAEYMELTGDLKDGVIRDLRLILADNARMAANGARRSAGDRTEMSKAVYSPCDLCPEDPTRAPLWQVKAVKVIHDTESKTIEYRDAWMEVAGVPVMYTPYLSHPDPTVRRRSGLLAPSTGGSSDLGYVAEVSYFIDIAPNIDATLTPIYTSKEGPVLATEYRHLFAKGSLEMSGSITNDSRDETRGHIRSKGRYDINDTWRSGFNLDRSTDDTYLRRYGFGDKGTLTSRAYAEGFRQRNYAAVSAYSFQGLEVGDDPGKTPIILPLVDFNHIGEPDRFGGRTQMDINLLGLTRTDGTDSRRVSTNVGWARPFDGPIGDQYTLTASLRGDAYHVEDVVRASKPGTFTGATGRIYPQASLDWRWPLIRRETESVHQMLVPLASFVASPYGGNPENIPNEDSQDFEFDDTNLFSTNRFTGLDRVEGGPRINYGVRWGIYGDQGGRSTILLGQSYRVKRDDTFLDGSGLEGNLSDYVARVDIAPSERLDFLYRTRLDKDNLEAKRHEFQISAGPKALRLALGYLYIDRQIGSEFAGREEIRYAVKGQLSRYWRAGINAVHDLSEDEGLRALGISLTYEDECLIFTTSLGRTFFEDRDLKPTDSIILRLMFKTLGEVETSVR